MSKSSKALDAPLLQWSDFEALEGEAENRCSNPKDLPKAGYFNLLAGEILTGSIPAIWRVLLQTRNWFVFWKSGSLMIACMSQVQNKAHES